MQQQTTLTPRWMKLVWLAAAVVAGVGLVLRHGGLYTIPGLTEPKSLSDIVRTLLVTAAGLFAVSQILIVLAPDRLGEWLRWWWPNLLVVPAAAVWWWQQRTREPLILDIVAGYILITGSWGIMRAGLHALTQGGGYGRFRPAGLRLLSTVLVITVLGGTILALPICWKGTYPASWDSTYPGQTCGELRTHWLNCTFTAAAALTCTGLSVYDIGCEFSRVGHLVILILMQLGGLAVLAIGASAGWRLRRLAGWGAPDDDISPRGVRRLIVCVFAVALLIEAAGAATVYSMWNGGPDANFTTASDRVLASAFHAVSAFCNVGLTLNSDSMIGYRDSYQLYAGLLPLMVLGSIGLPIAIEFVRRLFRARGLGLGSLSAHARYTLSWSMVLIGVVAALLVGIESTPGWQLRIPRADTPGRLQLPDAASRPIGSAPTTFAAIPNVQDRIRSQRMATMTPAERWKAAAFQSVAARTTGMRTIRMDEQSLSPASRYLLLAAMMIGGDIGGTAGGLRLTVLVLLLGAVRFNCMSPGPTKNVCPAAGRHHAIAIAAGLALSMGLLIGLTTVVLTYREAGSPIACLFEAVSACCNVGFSTGITTQLSTQGKYVVLLAMLFGRVLPLAYLLRCLRVPLIQMAPVALAVPAQPVLQIELETPPITDEAQ